MVFTNFNSTSVKYQSLHCAKIQLFSERFLITQCLFFCEILFAFICLKRITFTNHIKTRKLLFQ